MPHTNTRGTHLIEQDREEGLQQEEHDPDREAPVYRGALEERRGVVERNDEKAEEHSNELDDE